MLLVWGEKKTEKRVGFVADFCPICRQVSPFEITRIGLAGHFYFLSFGQGKLLGHLGKCQGCGTRKEVDALQYSSFEKDAKAPIELLAAGTFPNLRQIHSERLDLERRVNNPLNPLTSQERSKLLLEPFILLSAEVETKFAATQLDKQSGIGCIGTLVLASTIFFIAWNMPGRTNIEDTVFNSGLVVLAVGALYTLIQLAMVPGRHIRNHVVPLLARSLRPLNPTKQELAACLEQLKRPGYRIGKALKLDFLWKEVEAGKTWKDQKVG